MNFLPAKLKNQTENQAALPLRRAARDSQVD